MKRQPMNSLQRKEAMSGYAFIAPSLVLLIIFVILPILAVFYFGFTDFNGKMDMAKWLGFANYARLTEDPAIKTALGTTLAFVLIAVPAITFLALFLASMLAQNFQNKFGSFARSTLFIPVICSSALIGSIWYYLFSSDPSGVVNTICSLFGVEAVDWLGRQETALAALLFVHIWKSIGYFMVIFYAGIMEIPGSLFEAAEMDGASKLAQFRHIVMPGVRNITNFVVTINTIWSFQVFDIAFSLTNGGPGYGTTTLIFRIYKEGFNGWKMGYACAISCFLLILILAASRIVKAIFRESDD